MKKALFSRKLGYWDCEKFSYVKINESRDQFVASCCKAVTFITGRNEVGSLIRSIVQFDNVRVLLPQIISDTSIEDSQSAIMDQVSALDTIRAASLSAITDARLAANNNIWGKSAC